MAAEDTIREWSQERAYKDECGFVVRLRACGFADEQIVLVLSAVDEFCHHCWDQPAGCFCDYDD